MTHPSLPSDLHNAHVWAYFRQHPLDPDVSLFIAFEEGSGRAYAEILDLLVTYLLRSYHVPDGIRDYGLRIIAELIQAAQQQHARWLERKSKRKGMVGRPQAPSQGLHKGQALTALHAALRSENRLDPVQHEEALLVLQEALECAKKSPDKRRRRSQPHKHSLRAELALDVSAKLRQAYEQGERMSAAEAIRQVASERDALTNLRDSTRSLTEWEYDAQVTRIDNLCKKIEAAYYALKPYLTKGEGVLGKGLIPLEKMLDG